MKTTALFEDKILDSFKLKKDLNPDIFDGGEGHYKLKRSIRKKLLAIADGFMEFLGVDFFLHDVVLTGSLANYNWSKFSDVDLHLVIDFEEAPHDLTLLKEFFDSKKVIWNSQHDITVKGYPCEIYVQDIHEKHDSTGVYSVLHNKWVLKPERQNIRLDAHKIKTKAEEWMKAIDQLIEDVNSPGILERVDKVRERLKNFRQCGLDEGGEFSYENLVFKYLRRNDYIKKLLDLKNEIMDKELSLEEKEPVMEQLSQDEKMVSKIHLLPTISIDGIMEYLSVDYEKAKELLDAFIIYIEQGHVTRIRGNMDLFGTRISSLGNLQSVGGYLNLRYTKVTSLGNLKTVGRHLDLRDTHLKSLDNLQSVGGHMNIYGTNIRSFPNLKTIDGIPVYAEHDDDIPWQSENLG